MAYVNISSDGAKPVGPIGLKRAEKELIMRRYNSKYHNNHNANDNIHRVALIYGQQHPQYNSHERGGYINENNNNGPMHVPGNHQRDGRGQYYIQTGPGNGSY
jgi:hypothetical protein